MNAPPQRIQDLGLRIPLVALGGAAGVAFRGFAEQTFETSGLPNWQALMLCNLLGCFLIGVFFAALDPRFPRPVDARLLPADLPGMGRRRRLLASFSMTGVLGGLTTFSSFSLDAVQLIAGGRFAEAGISVMGSLLLGLGGLYLGVTLQHQLGAQLRGASLDGPESPR